PLSRNSRGNSGSKPMAWSRRPKHSSAGHEATSLDRIAARLRGAPGLLPASGALPPSAHPPEDLQEQLRQLKQQYEETTRALQRRITALEQQIANDSNARKAGEAQAAHAAPQAPAESDVVGQQ